MMMNLPYFTVHAFFFFALSFGSLGEKAQNCLEKYKFKKYTINFSNATLTFQHMYRERKYIRKKKQKQNIYTKQKNKEKKKSKR